MCPDLLRVDMQGPWCPVGGVCDAWAGEARPQRSRFCLVASTSAASTPDPLAGSDSGGSKGGAIFWWSLVLAIGGTATAVLFNLPQARLTKLATVAFTVILDWHLISFSCCFLQIAKWLGVEAGSGLPPLNTVASLVGVLTGVFGTVAATFTWIAAKVKEIEAQQKASIKEVTVIQEAILVVVAKQEASIKDVTAKQEASIKEVLDAIASLREKTLEDSNDVRKQSTLASYAATFLVAANALLTNLPR